MTSRSQALAVAEETLDICCNDIGPISEPSLSISLRTVAASMHRMPPGVFIQPTLRTGDFKPLPLITMNSKTVAEWSAYNIALYSAQRPPPLGTVDTDEKLAEMAREHLIKVANEGGGIVSQHKLKLISRPQVPSYTSLEALECARPMKPIAGLSINGQSFLECCATVLRATWRYITLVLLLNHRSKSGIRQPSSVTSSRPQCFWPRSGYKVSSIPRLSLLPQLLRGKLTFQWS